MKKYFGTFVPVIVLCCVPTFLTAQSPGKIPVVTLGTFHFNYPNLDDVKVDTKDQIDVLEPEYQEEIDAIVQDLSNYNPTIIVIERRSDQQSETDSLYTEYIKGNYRLSRREDEQLGFRLAKANALKKLYCVDEWGNFNENVARIVEGKDSLQSQRFESFYYNHPDSLKKTTSRVRNKIVGLRELLLLMNDHEKIRESLGDYLIGVFKYEVIPNDFFGVDFETGRWFNRNLKIFRNIQRIDASPEDRIIVIYGSGHLNLLNVFFECSPEYQLEDVKEFLK